LPIYKFVNLVLTPRGPLSKYVGLPICKYQLGTSSNIRGVQADATSGEFSDELSVSQSI